MSSRTRKDFISIFMTMQQLKNMKQKLILKWVKIFMFELGLFVTIITKVEFHFVKR